MKIGVSSFSYERLTKAGEMSMKDTISKAKEQGFDVIELLDIWRQAPDCDDPAGLAAELREEAARRVSRNHRVRGREGRSDNG